MTFSLEIFKIYRTVSNPKMIVPTFYTSIFRFFRLWTDKEVVHNALARQGILRPYMGIWPCITRFRNIYFLVTGDFKIKWNEIWNKSNFISKYDLISVDERSLSVPHRIETSCWTPWEKKETSDPVPKTSNITWNSINTLCSAISSATVNVAKHFPSRPMCTDVNNWWSLGC